MDHILLVAHSLGGSAEGADRPARTLEVARALDAQLALRNQVGLLASVPLA